MARQDELLLKATERRLMLRGLCLRRADLLLLMQRSQGPAMLAQFPLIMCFGVGLGIGFGIGIIARRRSGIGCGAFLKQAQTLAGPIPKLFTFSELAAQVLEVALECSIFLALFEQRPGRDGFVGTQFPDLLVGKLLALARVLFGPIPPLVCLLGSLCGALVGAP